MQRSCRLHCERAVPGNGLRHATHDHLTGALLDRLTATSHMTNMKNCKSLRGRLDEGESSDPA
ncbi:MAG TPA: hypothetical protein VMV69_23955 [Pirellulales bacterium]|nr:hypothetical protein [Pirellulales bacterium]